MKPVTAVDALQPSSTAPLPVLLLVDETTTGSASEGGEVDVASDEPERLGVKATPSPINHESDDDEGGNDLRKRLHTTANPRHLYTARRLTKGQVGSG